ncbi:MAG: ABC transporter permease [Actinobacteria bacterium]|nr:MAG: ABC transporter permease [Actinomycetota bacterium]REK38260.1 MAG: ABC transporter permease [Actinomycetota bacterium]
MTTARLGSVRDVDWRVALRRYGWNTGVWLLLIALLVFYASTIPSFGSFQIASIAKNSLPLVFLAIAQAVIVIAGGIDLAVGSMLILSNAVAAQLMDEQAFGITLMVAVLVILMAAALNGAVGWVISVSKVPDIVVTLATLFIIAGLALLVLPSPGGGTSDGFRALFTGSATGTGTNFWPALVMLFVPMLGAAWWMKHSRTGLSLYATGSDPTAAYLSGVNTARAKIVSYAVGGAFAAMGGLASLAITGSGESRFATASNFTLKSVAAIVLGGVALTGGIGSVVGAAAAGIVLFVLSPVLSAMGVDPNTAQVIQGALIVLVMMIAGIVQLRRERAA